jgi:Fe-S cluster assembly scaffold protein SufB
MEKKTGKTGMEKAADVLGGSGAFALSEKDGRSIGKMAGGASVLSEKDVRELSASLHEPDWLMRARLKAFSSFQKMHWPRWKSIDKKKMEVSYEDEWHYTDLSSYGLEEMDLGAADMRLKICKLDSDGVFVSSLHEALATHGKIVKEHLYSQVDAAHDKFVALNSALWSDGVFVHVSKGADVKEAVSFANEVKANGTANTRMLVVAEKGASAMIEDGRSADADSQGISTHVCEVFAGKSSDVYYLSWQNGGKKRIDYCRNSAQVEDGASMRWALAIFGGKLCKSTTESHFVGQKTRGEVYGVFFGEEGQHMDVTTNCVHKEPNCNSDMLVKGALSGNATSVYRGKIRIDRKAVEVKSDLNEGVMLLSENAHSEAIPSLDIQNNKVSAGHGAFVGEVDPEEQFYICTRGIGEKEARAMLVNGFFTPLVSKIPMEIARNRITDAIKERMSNA